MLINTDDFTEMGFEYPSGREARLEGCIKRAEYMLNALCGGTLYSAAANEHSAELVKQALAFQADALLREAEALENTKSTESSEKCSEKVSLGDFDYSSGTETKTKTEISVSVSDITDTVMRLLKAAGCFYGRGIAEVIK